MLPGGAQPQAPLCFSLSHNTSQTAQWRDQQTAADTLTDCLPALHPAHTHTLTHSYKETLGNTRRPFGETNTTHTSSAPTFSGLSILIRHCNQMRELMTFLREKSVSELMFPQVHNKRVTLHLICGKAPP